MELDNPVWWALQGSQRSLGTATGRTARFAPEVSPFGGFGGTPESADWEHMAELTGPGATVAVVATEEGLVVTPSGWTLLRSLPGAQMLGREGRIVRPGPPPGATPPDLVVPLGADDVPEMLELVAESRPGPFASRTVEFGGYVGVRREGRLVAMAGERLRPPGYAEISAVSTLPDHRRQGLAELLVGAVAAGITARGETPFLHVAGDNTNAIRLYRALGFTVRRQVWFIVLETPAG